MPSGTRTMRCTTATVPISWSWSGPGASTSGSLLATSASSRSGPFSTSSMSRMERSSPIASGATASGKTTVSFSGSTGRVSGRAPSDSPARSSPCASPGGGVGPRRPRRCSWGPDRDLDPPQRGPGGQRAA